ncbi:hypothetical protein RD792_003901 [Penstemon davidsonii]|uniref:Ribosomal protein L14 n=1 Tax=Penstemon davidsonii TaxID=160366 RepID=A0ABR0DGK5_9LAMI|nr:hypothetical protein RD792_003901 [Penstemon davidsonii]
MAASNSSKLFRALCFDYPNVVVPSMEETSVGRSILGGLCNNSVGSIKPSSEMLQTNFLSQLMYIRLLIIFLQQQRTFIQMGTILKVVDNSGAKKVMCIQALKGRKGARLGDKVVVSLKEALSGGKVKKEKGEKGEKSKRVYYGVVVRAAMQRGRCDGSEVKFDDNAVVLINEQGEPIGTRVFGPIPHELRKKKHLKILSLAEHIV